MPVKWDPSLKRQWDECMEMFVPGDVHAALGALDTAEDLMDTIERNYRDSCFNSIYALSSASSWIGVASHAINSIPKKKQPKELLRRLSQADKRLGRITQQVASSCSCEM